MYTLFLIVNIVITSDHLFKNMTMCLCTIYIGIKYTNIQTFEVSIFFLRKKLSEDELNWPEVRVKTIIML